MMAADRAHAHRTGTTTYADQLKAYNDSTQFVIVPHSDIGMVWVFAIGSLAVYSIVLGGWSSNNKYSLLGALRSSAQLISYEIPLGMAVLGVFLLAESLELEKIIDDQVQPGLERPSLPAHGRPAVHHRRVRRVQPPALRPVRV